jgi:hypothetical protein
MAEVFINQLQGGTTYLRSWSILPFFVVCIWAAALCPEKGNCGNTLTPYFYNDRYTLQVTVLSDVTPYRLAEGSATKRHAQNVTFGCKNPRFILPTVSYLLFDLQTELFPSEPPTKMLWRKIPYYESFYTITQNTKHWTQFSDETERSKKILYFMFKLSQTHLQVRHEFQYKNMPTCYFLLHINSILTQDCQFAPFHLKRSISSIHGTQGSVFEL